jgi:hypothetical protein
MDEKRTAYEKMLCITECGKNIFKAISLVLANNASDAMYNVNQYDGELMLIHQQLRTTTILDTKNNLDSAAMATADDYLPAFIYIVLKARLCSKLISNIKYITRFAFEKRLIAGADAYNFCTLVRNALLCLLIVH